MIDKTTTIAQLMTREVIFAKPDDAMQRGTQAFLPLHVGMAHRAQTECRRPR